MLKINLNKLVKLQIKSKGMFEKDEIKQKNEDGLILFIKYKN